MIIKKRKCRLTDDRVSFSVNSLSKSCPVRMWEISKSTKPTVASRVFTREERRLRRRRSLRTACFQRIERQFSREWMSRVRRARKPLHVNPQRRDDDPKCDRLSSVILLIGTRLLTDTLPRSRCFTNALCRYPGVRGGVTVTDQTNNICMRWGIGGERGKDNFYQLTAGPTIGSRKKDWKRRSRGVRVGRRSFIRSLVMFGILFTSTTLFLIHRKLVCAFNTARRASSAI